MQDNIRASAIIIIIIIIIIIMTLLSEYLDTLPMVSSKRALEFSTPTSPLKKH